MLAGIIAVKCEERLHIRTVVLCLRIGGRIIGIKLAQTKKKFVLLSPLILTLTLSSIVPAALPVIPFHLKFTQGEGDNKESVLDYEFTTHDLVIHISSLVGSVADPGSGVFLAPGSGMGRKSSSVADPGCLSLIRIFPHPGSRIQKQHQREG